VIPISLEVPFPNDVLTRCYPNGRLGGITVDGRPPGALGERVELTVRVEKPRREFVVKAQIAWVRHQASKLLKECFGVDFLEDAERMLAFARAELDASTTRTAVRVHTDLPVRLTYQGRTRNEHLIDISHGGAFVRSMLPPKVGEEVEVHLKPPNALLGGFTLKGRVAWHRRTGDARGFGVEFVDDGDLQSKLDKLLKRIS
jgi:Tfp pilus assembly protein PilZ